MRQLPLAQSHTSGRWERDIAGNRMWVSSAPPLTIAPEVLPGAGGGGHALRGGLGRPPHRLLLLLTRIWGLLAFSRVLQRY